MSSTGKQSDNNSHLGTPSLSPGSRAPFFPAPTGASTRKTHKPNRSPVQNPDSSSGGFPSNRDSNLRNPGGQASPKEQKRSNLTMNNPRRPSRNRQVSFSSQSQGGDPSARSGEVTPTPERPQHETSESSGPSDKALSAEWKRKAEESVTKHGKDGSLMSFPRIE